MATKTSQETIKKAYDLYLEGRSYAEIGKMLNVSSNTISKHLRKQFGITKKDHSKKIDQDIFKELWNRNKSAKDIADYFGVTEATIKTFRTRGKNAGKFKRTNLFSEQNKSLTYLQEQFIYGSLLGDLSLSKPDKSHPNSRLCIVQSKKQEEFFMKKVEILGEFMGAYKLTNLTPDKRTGKIYATYRGNSKAHPIFTKLYNELYKNGVKTITQEFLNKINSPIALAFWFMDDGTYRGTLATNGFSEQEIDLLIKWMKEKWNIDCTKQQNVQSTTQYVIHISEKSRKYFEKLIFEYVVPSMYYKLKYTNELSAIAESVG